MGRIFTTGTKLGESARLRAEAEERNMYQTPLGLAGYVAQHFDYHCVTRLSVQDVLSQSTLNAD